MYLFEAGKVDVEAIVAPTLNFVPGRGLRYAVSFDEQPFQVIDVLARNSMRDWETAVKDNVRKSRSNHTVEKPGYHTLKFRMVDPGVVLQKLVVNLGGVKRSYLGPPESYHNDVTPAKPWRQGVTDDAPSSGGLTTADWGRRTVRIVVRSEARKTSSRPAV